MRMQLKNIICATDFSDYSNHTIPYGVALAREFDARLYICHIIDLSSIAIYGEFQMDPVGQQDRILAYAREQLEQLIGKHEVPWEPLVSVGRPAEEIARLVEAKQVNLVISATRGRSGLKRLLLGSVTERLMRTISCPLLVVHSTERRFISPEAHRVRLEKILVGYDFSPDAGLALEYALSLAQEFQAELHLVHVMEPSAYRELLQPSGEPDSELDLETQERLMEKLNGLIPEDARHWCSPVTCLLEGHPYDELNHYARENDIDMIALGVRGRGRVTTFFLGSTTDRVVRRAPCPVLSVGQRVTESPR